MIKFRQPKVVAETMAVRCKSMKKCVVCGNKEFDCDKCISVAQDFLLFYLNEHLPGKK